MTDTDPRPWWRDGVLGRLDPGEREAPARLLERLGDGPEGLGLDGVLLRPSAERAGLDALEAAGRAGVRILIDLPEAAVPNSDALVETARRWLRAGAAGIAIACAPHRPSPRATVTRLHGSGDEADQRPLTPAESARQVVDAEDDRVLVALRPAEQAVGAPPPGPHLVIETTLSRKPWRAAALGEAVEHTIASLPAAAWPGYAMGAPRRGPFAVGLAMDDALACSAALHLTLRGTPCIELGEETELPANPKRRAWYRRLIDLRRSEPTLHRGDFRRIRQEKSVLGYLREHEAERLCVLLNLGRRTRAAQLPTGFGWTVLLSNGAPVGHRFAGGEISLPGCGVLIARAGTPQSRTLGGSGQRRATGV